MISIFMQPEDTILCDLLNWYRSTDQFSFTWNATENMMIRAGWGGSFAAQVCHIFIKVSLGLLELVTTMVDIITKVL